MMGSPAVPSATPLMERLKTTKLAPIKIDDLLSAICDSAIFAASAESKSAGLRIGKLGIVRPDSGIFDRNLVIKLSTHRCHPLFAR
jgi:hypothetical protein